MTFLRSHPIFRGGTFEDLSRLAGGASWVRLEKDEFLFHEEDPSDSVYLVEQGKLEILHERLGTQEQLHVTTVGKGSVVGEIGVMRGDVRTSSVKALASSLLLSLPARDFIAFARATPTAAMRLAEILADRTRAILQRDSIDLRGAIWGLVKGSELDALFAFELAKAASTCRPIKVYCTDPVAFQHRSAAFVHVEEPPHPSPHEVSIIYGSQEALLRWSLALDAVISTQSLHRFASVPVRRRMVVKSSGETSSTEVRYTTPQATAARIVRWLERKSIGLALGGGGALGLCHIGVLEVFKKHGIPIDVLTGTSAGAMVGGFYLALGLEPLKELSGQFPRSRLISLLDPSFFVTGVIKGDRLLRLFRKMLDNCSIESLPIPYAALALDLETGEERALSHGPLADVIRASISLPSVFSPFLSDGDDGVSEGVFVDAGGVNNVPVDVARALGAARVVAVNVINRPKGWSEHAKGWRRWSPFGRSKSAAYAELVSFARNGERQSYSADLAIFPDTQAFGFTQFYRSEELIEVGRMSAEAILPQLKALAT